MEIKKHDTNLQFLARGGEMGELMRAKDWSKTSLNSPENWPQSLRTALSILLNSKFPMFLFWGTELISFYNDAFRPSLGKDGKHPSILGMKGEEVWSEIWNIIKPLLDQVLAGGEAIWREDQLIPIYRNGKIEDVYWTFSYSPVNDESGNIAGVFVTCSETTEKIKTFNALNESKNQLEFAIDAAELGTFDYNPITNKFSANQRLKDWFGLSAEEQIELHHAINVIAEKDRQRIMANIQKALEYSVDGNYEMQYTIIQPVTQREIIIFAKGKVLFNEEKIAYSFKGTLQDITNQVKSQSKIEASEQRFQAAIAAVEGILWTNNAIGEMEGEQPGWASLTGQTYTEYQGYGWSNAVHPDDAQPTIDAWNEALKEHKTFIYEHRLKTIDGSWRVFSVRAIPLFNEDGSLREWVGVHTDITERKMVETKVQESKEKLNIVIEASELGTFDLNLKTDELQASTRFHEIFGYLNGEQLTHNEFLSHLYPDDKEIRNQAYKIALEKGNLSYQSRIITRDKAIHFIEVKGKIFYDTNLFPNMLIGTCRDITLEKNQQKILEESEEKSNLMIETSELGTWELDLKTHEVKYSKKYLEIFGYKDTIDLEHDKLVKHIHPEDMGLRSMAFNEAMKTGKLYFEARLIWNDQSIHWMSGKGKVFYDEQNQPEKMLGTIRDITEDKKQRKILEESEQRYHHLIASSPSAIGVLKGKDYVISTANDAIIEIWGKGKQVFGKPYFELMPELIEQGYKKVFDEIFTTGEPFNGVEMPIYILQNGKLELKYYNFLLYPQRNINGEVDGIGIIASEVTSQALLNNKIKESEQKFRLLADSMPQHIWTSDTEGRLNYYNKSVFDYSGLSVEQIFEDGWLQMVHPDDRERNIKEWKKAIETGKDFLFEHRFRRYDGQYRWQLSRAIPQKDAHGNIQMWVGTSTDIQEQRVFLNELEKKVGERTDQLNQKNAELEKMNKELQSFAYISSHDLQEPLRKIQTFVSRIEEKEQQHLSDIGKDYFKRMRSAAKRMQTLIDDLLAYSRTNTAERKYEAVHLQTIIDEVKADLKEEIEQKNAIIETIDTCEVKIIPFQFHQLLQNLISNSLKFSKPEIAPHIIIKCKVAQGKAFENVKLDPEKTYCHIMVSDNGIGFEQEYNEKIFELFQRLHGKLQYSGTGIGLAIVKKIIENHNGLIKASGKKDSGATFGMYIPTDL